MGSARLVFDRPLLITSCVYFSDKALSIPVIIPQFGLEVLWSVVPTKTSFSIYAAHFDGVSRLFRKSIGVREPDM